MAKQNRFGQATSFDKATFRKVRDAFVSDSHRAIFAIAWYTTERWGAVLQLRVEDCYDSHGNPKANITIPARIRKDNETREVPIVRALERELKAYRPYLERTYKRMSVAMLPGNYLFPSPQKFNAPITFQAADRALRRTLKKLDLHEDGYSTHSTRRGSITEMASAGLSVPVIRSITGHQSLSSLSRYIDVSERQRMHALSVLE